MYIDERVLMTLNHGIRDKNLVVVAVSQCKVGRVELESYGAGKQLSDIGVISGKDMTLEAGMLIGRLLSNCSLSWFSHIHACPTISTCLSEFPYRFST